jgi:hypothetical protein
MLGDMTLDISDVDYSYGKHGDNEGMLSTKVVLNNGMVVCKSVRWELPHKTELDALKEMKEFRRRHVSSN